MKLEKQVVSLKLAKKLKKLGVKQESLFYWVYSNIERKYVIVSKPDTGINHEDLGDWEYEVYSAFTVAELWEKLPNYVYMISTGGGRHSDRVGYLVGESISKRRLWEVAIAKGFHRDKDRFPKEIHSKKGANSLAKMLIYLIENKLFRGKDE